MPSGTSALTNKSAPLDCWRPTHRTDPTRIGCLRRKDSARESLPRQPVFPLPQRDRQHSSRWDRHTTPDPSRSGNRPDRTHGSQVPHQKVTDHARQHWSLLLASALPSQSHITKVTGSVVPSVLSNSGDHFHASGKPLSTPQPKSCTRTSPHAPRAPRSLHVSASRSVEVLRIRHQNNGADGDLFCRFHLRDPIHLERGKALARKKTTPHAFPVGTKTGRLGRICIDFNIVHLQVHMGWVGHQQGTTALRR